jgi:hypothetical protein
VPPSLYSDVSRPVVRRGPRTTLSSKSTNRTGGVGLDRGPNQRNSCARRRLLIINPNSSEACSAGIAAAIAPFRVAWETVVDVVTPREGPPAIYTWHSVVQPMCRLVERESAYVYIIARASDPRIDALRAVRWRWSVRSGSG